MEEKARRTFLKCIERTCLYSGMALVLLASFMRLEGIAQNHSAVSDFNSIREQIASPAEQKTWSKNRKAGSLKSLEQNAGTTLAVLRVPSVGIEVAVFDSLSETALRVDCLAVTRANTR